MFASFDVPHHPDRLPGSPVLGLGPALVVDGSAAVQSQRPARESPINPWIYQAELCRITTLECKTCMGNQLPKGNKIN